MLNFLICGLAFWSYAYLKFTKSKIFYPSVVFSFMWGANCIVTSLILGGYVENLYLEKWYVYKYMDHYILYFTAVSIIAFILAHRLKPGNDVNMEFSLDYLDSLLDKYYWIMWVNFFGGLLRLILIIQMVGFNSVMDYRLAANSMMNSGAGAVGLVFRLTSYVQMLANFYVALYGFKTGFGTIDLKSTLKIFILYAPTQMATGGRLFILYFILFFFGSFLLGRGLSIRIEGGQLLLNSEKKVIITSFVGLLSLVSVIAIARQNDIDTTGPKESALAKFTYITEGMLATEHCMNLYNGNNVPKDNGQYLLTGTSRTYMNYRSYLLTTDMSSIVVCIITPLYTGFGFWGSLIVWFVIAFLLELLSINCLGKLTIIRFFIYLTVLKIFYESVMSTALFENVPVYELIILIAIFKKQILGEDNNGYLSES